jgi:hypothetical protein
MAFANIFDDGRGIKIEAGQDGPQPSWALVSTRNTSLDLCAVSTSGLVFWGSTTNRLALFVPFSRLYGCCRAR